MGWGWSVETRNEEVAKVARMEGERVKDYVMDVVCKLVLPYPGKFGRVANKQGYTASNYHTNKVHDVHKSLTAKDPGISLTKAMG